MRKFRTWLSLLILGKEGEYVAVIYAALIIKGAKKFSEVPGCINDEVRQVLIDLEVPKELYEDTHYRG